MSSPLVVLAIALLALVVGINIGAQLTARRYRRSLHTQDITEYLRGRSRR